MHGAKIKKKPELLYVQINTSYSLLYILWTVHRDTYTWERPTKCTLFL